MSSKPVSTGDSPGEKISNQKRIQSIDFLRGLVMVFMALDHTRTFLHSSYTQFNAEDLTQTTPALFFTRWITHFCAPVFIFLTGTSAYLLLQKVKSKKKVFNFLITRGCILLLLELTLFRFCWQPMGAFFPAIYPVARYLGDRMEHDLPFASYLVALPPHSCFWISCPFFP